MTEWSGKSRGGSFGYKFFIMLLNKFGRKSAYAFLYLVVPYFFIFAPKNTHASWLYWRHIHGKGRIDSIRSIFKHYICFGQSLIDKIASKTSSDNSFEYEFHNYERFLQILNGGTGAVLIGAHFGNWQIGGNFFGEYAPKLNLVMYDAEYKKIKEQLEKAMGEKNYNIIPVNDDELSHIFKIKDALDNHEYICFQGDRYFGKGNTMEATFMGHKALFPAGPFQIAARFKVPVIFYFSEKETANKYAFRFFEASPTIRAKVQKPENQLLSQYIEVLESRLSVHPEQWFNFYNFWNINKKEK